MTWVRYTVLGALVCAALSIAGCGGGGNASTTLPTQGGLHGYIYARSRTAKVVRQAVTTRLTQQAPAGTTGLNGAVVTLDPTGRQVTTHNDASGNPGYFEFTGLDAGTYNATVSYDGYYSATFQADVNAGEVTSAGLTGDQTVLQPQGSVSRKKWTFMVYLDADGNLESGAILNMNQMEKVGSNDSINIVVQFDRAPGYDATNGDWTGTRRYYITKDDDSRIITSPVVQNMGETDMGKEASLHDFVSWATTNYPADHYAFVMWDHGAGWRSRSAATSRGIAFDDTSNSHLSMADFAAGLNVSGAHFDLVAIDACLMAMMEVSYELKDVTDFIAASEGSPLEAGYPYDSILARLASNPAMGAEDFGKVIVAEHVANQQQLAPATQSLIRTASLPDFASKVNNLASAIIATLPGSATALSAARKNAQAYDYQFYHDIYDFARLAQTGFSDTAVSNAAQAVMQGLAGTNGPIVAEAHSGSEVANSHGLSIYLPSDAEYYSGYNLLAFSQAYPRWYELVRLSASVNQ